MSGTSRSACRLGGAAVVVIAGAILAGCSSAEPAPIPTRSASAPYTPLAPGWRASDGTIVLGTGPVRIDVWFDLMCPYCKKFDGIQRDALRDWSSHSRTQLVLHPLAFLDRASEGSAYSTRAATVLAAAATQDERAVLPIMFTLYDQQPAEHTSGLSDDELITIAAQHEIDVRAVLQERPHDAIFKKNSAAAFSGADAITGTPTVRIDGTQVPSEVLYDMDLRQQVEAFITDNFRSRPLEGR